MHTIIVGCGRVGASLAARLAHEGDDVTIIDLRTEAFDRLEDGFPGQAIRADGTDEDALRRAGAEGADRFFALTEGDNRNILAAQLAAERFRIPTVVAKINDPVRAEAYSALGLATVCRTSMMVESLAGFLGLSSDALAAQVLAPTGRHPGARPAAPVGRAQEA
jgi:trk system potassium uptake protein TrkA